MDDKEIASALLQLFRASSFPAAALEQVVQIAAWLDRLAKGETIVVETDALADD